MHSSRMRTARSSSRLLGGRVCLSACWDTHRPGVGLETSPSCGPGDPLGVGLETPPRPDPLNFPYGCGPEDPPGQTPQLPPGCGPGDPSSPDPTTSPHPPPC